MNQKVQPDSRIRLKYRLSLVDGDVLDETDEDGATIHLGQGEFATGLEALMIGLQVGDQKDFHIRSDLGLFGEWDAENVQSLERASLGSEVPLEEGQIVEFETPEGPVAALIDSLDEETITVDFNHPLCNHDLDFSVEILEIENGK